MKNYLLQKKGLFLIIILLIIIAILTIRLNKTQVKYSKEKVSYKNQLESLNNQFNSQSLQYREWAKKSIPFIDFSTVIKNQNFRQKNNNEKIRFCIVIPSYNNEKYVKQNLESVLAQDYSNWHLIYFDDASTDNTADIVNKITTKYSLDSSKLTYIKYQTRKRSALYAFYNAAHNYCADNEVMVNLDGDDFLAHPEVLSDLNKIYSQNDIWITAGNLINTAGGLFSCDKEVLNKDWANLRKLPWTTTALRTYYTWLFKKIDLSYLQHEGKFFTSAWDLALMFPMLEIAGSSRMQCAKDITYVYWLHDKNDHALYLNEVKKYEKIIRDMQPYSVLK